MVKRKIEFDQLNWNQAAEGFRYKEQKVGSHKIRLVEISDTFVEKEWCLHSHTGIVIEGRLDIQFEDELITYSKGEGILIMSGDLFKHKAQVRTGESATLLLFEPN
ncbi:MAG: quercetin dioxygenase-like cupin family protein [Limisphaerales bacterium]|jgi:quercetin dioxygenase-like cupin family protein